MTKGISNNLISLFFFKCFYFINELRGLTITSIILSHFHNEQPTKLRFTSLYYTYKTTSLLSLVLEIIRIF